MRKKGYYLTVENYGSSGVEKKINMQLKCFSSCFDIQRIVIESKKISLLHRIFNILPFRSLERRYDVALDKIKSPNFVYIRRTYADKKNIMFIKSIRDKYPDCKIIVELPVYPYDKEMKRSLYTRFLLIKEKHYREYYKRYIDRFVTYSKDDSIFGVSTIITMNGVDTDSISTICPSRDYDLNNINLIAIAQFAPHHGYERIIQGFYDYYKTEQHKIVHLHLIGDGTEKRKYIKMVNKYQLGDKIHFHEPMYGSDLDDMYDIADAGLNAFGVYKDGFSDLCTIKAREYLAKGLPVILGAKDRLFDNTEYGLFFSNDASPIDINRIVEFVDNLYKTKSREKIIEEIRNFAKENVDNVITMKPIIEYINE